MQLKLFVIPIKNLGAAEAEMNGFLRGHRVLAVKKEFVADGASSQGQTMSSELLKIGGVVSRELGAAANRHGGNHAIRQAAGAAAGLVEQARGEHGIGRQEWLGLGKDLSRERLASGIHRPAQELRPSDGADIQGFLSGRPSGELSVGSRSDYGDLNEEVGAKMGHGVRKRSSAPCFANGAHPLRSLLRIESEVLLQGIQGLKRSGLRLAVLDGLQNREQPAAFFRQPAGFFRDHVAVVDLNFRSHIAHGRTLTDSPPIANQVFAKTNS